MSVHRLLVGLAATLAMLPAAYAGKIQEFCMSEPPDHPCWFLLRQKLYPPLPAFLPGRSSATTYFSSRETREWSTQFPKTDQLSPRHGTPTRITPRLAGSGVPIRCGRAGFALASDRCPTIFFNHLYPTMRTVPTTTIAVNPRFVIQSMMSHPSSYDADTPWNAASAHQDIKYTVVDLDFRHVFLCDDRYSLDFPTSCGKCAMRV